MESRTGASAAQNKVPSLYYSLYYSPAPFPLEPIFTPKGAEREKGSGGGEEKKKKSAARRVRGEQLFESSAPGFRCSVGQTPALLECLPLPRPSFRGPGIEKSFSPSVSSEPCGLSLQKELKERKETETRGEAEEKSILLDVRWPTNGNVYCVF